MSLWTLPRLVNANFGEICSVGHDPLVVLTTPRVRPNWDMNSGESSDLFIIWIPVRPYVRAIGENSRSSVTFYVGPLPLSPLIDLPLLAAPIRSSGDARIPVWPARMFKLSPVEVHQWHLAITIRRSEVDSLQLNGYFDEIQEKVESMSTRRARKSQVRSQEDPCKRRSGWKKSDAIMTRLSLLELIEESRARK
jgi:hypothetical protein